VLLPATNSSCVSAELTGEVSVGKDPLKISLLETLGTALQTERSRVRFPMVPNYSYGFDSASNINKYQEYFLGGGGEGKGGRCVGLTTLPPFYVDCLDIWEPQPPGTFRGSPGLYTYCFTFTRLKHKSKTRRISR
jgi:hypothetical protein